MTKPNSRTSALAKKHKDLGSGLEDWNGMGTDVIHGIPVRILPQENKMICHFNYEFATK